MDELDIFENLVTYALSEVDNSYYLTTYYNIQNFRNALQYRAGRIRGNDFDRYGERVFCYEFYHQLRKLIDSERNENPEFLQGALLQGEVEKMQILQLIERFGLYRLSGEYAPDFLMHTPGNANHHPFVIEVKCENDVNPNKVLLDLRKLNEFVTRYNYQRAIFLTVNTESVYIENLLQGLNNRILELEGRNRIKVICKTNQETEHRIWQL